MARNGSGVYSAPAGTEAVSLDPISSTKLNTLVADLVADANLARPISVGGTGASSASAARTALGLEIGADVLAYDSHLGSATDAAKSFIGDTAMPTVGDSGVTDSSIERGFYAYSAADGSTGGPDGQTKGHLLHLRKAADNETQMLFTNDGRVFARGRHAGSWSAWRSLDGVPPGAIQMFATSTVPFGWISCDGSAISRTDYPELFAEIGTDYGVGNGSTTFNVPDLRGEFLRSWDDGRGVDTGRAIGTAQAGAIESHTHDVNITIGTTDTSRVGGVTDGGTGNSGYTSTAEATGGDETRPRNIALHTCIKY